MSPLTGSEMTDSTSGSAFLEPPGGGEVGATTATSFSVPVDPHSIVARLQHTQGGEGAQARAAASHDIPDAASSGAGVGAGVGALAQQVDQDLELEPGAPAEEETVRAKESPPHSIPLEDEDDEEEEHLTPEQLGMPHLLSIHLL